MEAITTSDLRELTKELKRYGKHLTEKQKMHISVIAEVSISTVREYIRGNAAKEKTAREILEAIKSLKKGKRVSIA